MSRTDIQRSPLGQRLDQAMVMRGLVSSRTKAQQRIAAGAVRVNTQEMRKSSHMIYPADQISVDLGDNYVSRGALKLAEAFSQFIPQGLCDAKGLDCLDIGASTGGFTDVLLRRGAKRVIALDVGHGQLDARIAADPRVCEMDGINIREVESKDLPFTPKLVVSDVSFISLTYIIPVIRSIIGATATCILLVKPQFEVGRTRLGHHGVVESQALRKEALDTVISCAERNGFTVRASIPSPIRGTHGNTEFLLWLEISS